jgi:hypothetical protein
MLAGTATRSDLPSCMCVTQPDVQAGIQQASQSNRMIRVTAAIHACDRTRAMHRSSSCWLAATHSCASHGPRTVWPVVGDELGRLRHCQAQPAHVVVVRKLPAWGKVGHGGAAGSREDTHRGAACWNFHQVMSQGGQWCCVAYHSSLQHILEGGGSYVCLRWRPGISFACAVSSCMQ